MPTSHYHPLFFALLVFHILPAILQSGETNLSRISQTEIRNEATYELPTNRLCGVPVKGTDLIEQKSKGVSKSSENESLELLLEALTASEKKALLDLLNNGSIEELTTIKGIATSRAKTITSSRPFHKLEEIMLLRGFGFSITANVLQHEIADS